MDLITWIRVLRTKEHMLDVAKQLLDVDKPIQREAMAAKILAHIEELNLVDKKCSDLVLREITVPLNVERNK